MRNSIYDDDNAYPNSNSSNRSNASSDKKRSEYERQYEEYVDATENYSDSDSKSKAMIVVLSVIAGVAFLVVIVLAVMFFGGNKKAEEKEAASSVQTVETGETEAMLKKAEHYLEVGDYKSAEALYNKLLDTESADDDVYTMHSMLYNFNKALEAADEKDYDKAKRFSDKISSDYVYYPGLCDDVDSLNSEISKGKKAYEEFQTIEDLMHSKKYAQASEAIEYINEEYLSSDDRRVLNSYREKIDDESDDDVVYSPVSGQLTADDAQELVAGYCAAFVDAINYRDFSIVEDYMHPSSTLYAQQKKLLNHYADVDLHERFDGLKLNSLRKVNDTKWIASVTESETIYYASGASESNTYHWDYTIEYIGGEYYLTAISD